MRITNSTILRGYNRNLNRLKTNKTQSEHRIQSGRQFDRASQSPLNAAKALIVRRNLYENAQYKENLEVADKFYTEAETSLLQVSDELAGIRETLVAAVNSTKEESTDLQVYAQQLETKAKELCAIFNTDTAERMIFGGESNNPEPFRIQDGVVLYHDVPINASSNPKSFPYSNDVYIDMGIGIVVDSQSQQIDPQSALKVSFNGAEVTGCGSEGGLADINTDDLKVGEKYIVDVYAGEEKRSVTFTYDGTMGSIKDKLDEAFNNVEGYSFDVTDEGLISATRNGSTIPVTVLNNVKSPNKIGIDNLYGYTDDFTIDLEALTDGKEYRIDVTADGETRTVKFTAGADAAASRAALNTALSDAFKDMKVNPQASADGRISAEGKTVLVKTGSTIEGENAVELTRNMAYSKNYIQITLDAAKALRNGDIAYANGCIDKIVTATENLLVEIADLGCNEEYIEFTTGRFETRELNLKDRQKTLEATDLEKEITMMKTYEALYNAALQMASSVVPNSIFNYIK